jgi:hypothetical protein
MTENSVHRLLYNIRYLAHEGLTEENITNDMNLFFESVVQTLLQNPVSFDIVKDDLLLTRNESQMILNTIIKSINLQIEKLDTTLVGLEIVNDFRNKYPVYISINTPKEALAFFDNLDKEEYSYSEAAELLNLSRQTLSKYITEELHGFKLKSKKKVDRQEIYEYHIKNQLIK